MHRSAIFVFTACAALALAGAPAADAQVDLDHWDDPVAAQTLLSLDEGSVQGDTLYLPRDEQVELEVHAIDQDGRRFPQNRFRFEFEFDRECGGLVELTGATDDSVTLDTGRGAGECDVLLWIPGNMNLDRRLRVVVGRAAGPAPSTPSTNGEPVIDTREELVAASIHRALLDREPERGFLSTAALEVSRGNTRTLVRGLLASTEFQQRQATTPAQELLADLYRGLLGREPDSGGVRTYLDEIEAGRYEEVIDILLRSSEFQQRLARELN